MKNPEVILEDSSVDNLSKSNDGIDLKMVDKNVGLFDINNPPEGLVFIGDPLPDGVTDALFRNFSEKPLPRRRKNLI